MMFFIFLLIFPVLAEQPPCRHIRSDNWTNAPQKNIEEFVKKLLEDSKKEQKPEPVIIQPLK
jgi:hypothetical protein